jgi:hypothetical protein
MIRLQLAPESTRPKVDKFNSPAFKFFAKHTCRRIEVREWSDWLRFKKESANRQWIYLYRFENGVLPIVEAWGTSAKTNDRLRKAGLFHRKLAGKYDRRVDLLMLREIYGMPKVWVFEASNDTKAREIEGEFCRKCNQKHCYSGFSGTAREEISREIIAEFEETRHWRELCEPDRIGFKRYLSEVFFRRRTHPRNPNRMFNFGDSLEPGFLRELGFRDLEPAIERALRVEFYRRRAG